MVCGIITFREPGGNIPFFGSVHPPQLLQQINTIVFSICYNESVKGRKKKKNSISSNSFFFLLPPLICGVLAYLVYRFRKNRSPCTG